MDTSTWNHYTLCGILYQNVSQIVCWFQIELLNRLIDKKNNPPLLETFKTYLTRGVCMCVCVHFQWKNLSYTKFTNLTTLTLANNVALSIAPSSPSYTFTHADVWPLLILKLCCVFTGKYVSFGMAVFSWASPSPLTI